MSLLSKASLLWRERSSLKSLLNHSSPSFSQYGEDVLISALLHPGNDGTYVDVGANHPISGSNTFRLYARGWSGVAIDPNPRFAAEFRKLRPRDTFLVEGAASQPGELVYYSFENDVLNTFDGPLADGRVAQGETLLSKTSVACRPLAEIVDQHIAGRQIDLLNVDCEGFDIDVLESLDLGRRRPTVIIIEDYPRYLTFQRDLPPMRLEQFLRGHRYLPLAQTAWSAIFVAEDWEALFRRSKAYHADRVQNGYMPGQATLSEADR